MHGSQPGAQGQKGPCCRAKWGKGMRRRCVQCVVPDGRTGTEGAPWAGDGCVVEMHLGWR